MHLVIAAGIFPPDIGGPATYAERLALYVSKKGHSVRVICYSSNTAATRYPFTVIRVKRRPLKGITFLSYLFRLAWHAFWADCIFAQGPVAGGLQAFIVHVLIRKPYLVKITGDYAWEQASARYRLSQDIDLFQRHPAIVPLRVRLMNILQRIVARNASCCVVPSVYLQSMVTVWGVAKAHTAVIYNAAPAWEDVSDRSKPAADPLVMTVGRLVPWKGFGTLISLWPKILSRHPTSKLIIVGDGPELKKLRGLIDQLKLADHVRLLGKVDQEELHRWYRKAGYFVLNSGYEGFSHALLEAMSAGLPCAVSDRGGNPELIRNGSNGLLFTYDDEDQIIVSLEKLLNDTSAAERFGREAYVTARQFTIDRMLSHTIALLEASQKNITA